MNSKDLFKILYLFKRDEKDGPNSNVTSERKESGFLKPPVLGSWLSFLYIMVP